MTELKLCSNFSTDALEVMAEELAEKTGTPLERRPMWGVSSDALSFLKPGIPTIVFDGLDLFRIHELFIDQLKPIKPKLMKKQYLFFYKFLTELDQRKDPVSILNEDTQIRTVKERPKILEAPVVKLLEPGTKLRTPLRYKFKAGGKERMIVEMIMDMDMNYDKQRDHASLTIRIPVA